MLSHAHPVYEVSVHTKHVAADLSLVLSYAKKNKQEKDVLHLSLGIRPLLFCRQKLASEPYALTTVPGVRPCHLP